MSNVWSCAEGEPWPETSRLSRIGGRWAGWGSTKSVTEILLREAVPLKGPFTLWHQNKPSGFACVSCSYAKPDHQKPFEFCENGAKATAWEITDKRCSLDFFAEHTVTELENWSDYDLEESGSADAPYALGRGYGQVCPH